MPTEKIDEAFDGYRAIMNRWRRSAPPKDPPCPIEAQWQKREQEQAAAARKPATGGKKQGGKQ